MLDHSKLFYYSDFFEHSPLKLIVHKLFEKFSEFGGTGLPITAS
jgi:hypothetical protein